MNDVLEYLIDGTSGISPGSVTGSAIIAGVCSLGVVGKGYLLGVSSDLDTLLGVGPLVDHLRDVFATCGQDATVIAVPVAGQPGGYITPVDHAGTGPLATMSGIAAGNADVHVVIVDSGAPGACTAKVSTDGGATFDVTETVPQNGQIPIGNTGATMVMAAGDLVAADVYTCLVRSPVGPVAHVGTGPAIAAAGTALADAEVVLQIVGSGSRNIGTYQLSLDNGASFGVVKTIPVDGLIPVGTTGVTITYPAIAAVSGDIYSFQIIGPVPSVSAVLAALTTPLSLYDIEFIHVVSPSDSSDWAAMGATADDLWSKHRPTFFLAHTRLPYADETIDDWVAALTAERQGFAHRFVAVCAAYGDVTDSTGSTLTRNACGLAAGRLLNIPVMRALGRVRDGNITQLALPSLYTETHQAMLESAGYLTARRYAGLSGAYWGDERTMADTGSDYRYLTVLRVVFKAVRLARIAALKSMYDEAGDPTLGVSVAGIAYLKTSLETALKTMVKAVPQEMADQQVNIPAGQDIVNNGVACELTLIGIPIIRTIKLFARYVYAGGAFDPRLK